MNKSVILVLFYCATLTSFVNTAPNPLGPFTVLPPIGMGHRKIGKLALLKHKGEFLIQRLDQIKLKL